MAKKEENKPLFVNRELADMTTEYKSWLSDLKQRYRRAQVRAVVKVNGEMLNFYWELGRDICEMSKTAKYGDGLLKNVTLDLQSEFPGDTGLSLTNIKAARRWYKTYYQWVKKSQQPVDFFGSKTSEDVLNMPYFFANVPWGQHIFINQKRNPWRKLYSTFHKYVNMDGAVLNLNTIIRRDISQSMPEQLPISTAACRKRSRHLQNKCSKVHITLSFYKCHQNIQSMILKTN